MQEVVLTKEEIKVIKSYLKAQEIDNKSSIELFKEFLHIFKQFPKNEKLKFEGLELLDNEEKEYSKRVKAIINMARDYHKYGITLSFDNISWYNLKSMIQLNRFYKENRAKQKELNKAVYSVFKDSKIGNKVMKSLYNDNIKSVITDFKKKNKLYDVEGEIKSLSTKVSSIVSHISDVEQLLALKEMLDTKIEESLHSLQEVQA